VSEHWPSLPTSCSEHALRGCPQSQSNTWTACHGHSRPYTCCPTTLETDFLDPPRSSLKAKRWKVMSKDKLLSYSMGNSLGDLTGCVGRRDGGYRGKKRHCSQQHVAGTGRRGDHRPSSLIALVAVWSLVYHHYTPSPLLPVTHLSRYAGSHLWRTSATVVVGRATKECLPLSAEQNFRKRYLLLKGCSLVQCSVATAFTYCSRNVACGSVRRLQP